MALGLRGLGHHLAHLFHPSSPQPVDVRTACEEEWPCGTLSVPTPVDHADRDEPVVRP
jgi:hypothetical protein